VAFVVRSKENVSNRSTRDDADHFTNASLNNSLNLIYYGPELSVFKYGLRCLDCLSNGYFVANKAYFFLFQGGLHTLVLGLSNGDPKVGRHRESKVLLENLTTEKGVCEGERTLLTWVTSFKNYLSVLHKKSASLGTKLLSGIELGLLSQINTSDWKSIMIMFDMKGDRSIAELKAVSRGIVVKAHLVALTTN
jgi:hypothetical protein